VYIAISGEFNPPEFFFEKFGSLGPLQIFDSAPSSSSLNVVKHSCDGGGEWIHYMNIMNAFLRTRENHVAIMTSKCGEISTQVYEMLRALESPELLKIDLLQFSFQTRRGRIVKPVFMHRGLTGDLRRLIGPTLASFQIVYTAWIWGTYAFFFNCKRLAVLAYKIPAPRILKLLFSRISNRRPLVFVEQEHTLRKLLNVNSPLVYHSFENGLDGFVISRSFAECLSTINNPTMLELNTLLMASARTQNLTSIRLLRSLY
jgi:hypothetical protein